MSLDSVLSPIGPAIKVGQELRRLRMDRGLSLAQTAAQIGITKAALGHWETGRNLASGPGLERLLSILGAGRRLRALLLAATSPDYARIALALDGPGPPVDIGQVIRAMRLRRQFTQSQLASAAGVSQGTIAKWENGALVPDIQSLHTLCFALGATGEEVAALSCARPAEREPSERRRMLFRELGAPQALREVILLGLEAEHWWAACKDPAAELLLCDARAERAKWYLQMGRTSEVEMPARGALSLAQSEDARSSATIAVWALFELSRKRSGAHMPTKLLETWVATVQDPGVRAWAMSMNGLAYAEQGREREATGTIERSIDLAAQVGQAEPRNRILNLTEMHLTLGNGFEAYEAIEREDKQLAAVVRAQSGDFDGLSARARAILACGELPPDDVMNPLRSVVESSGVWAYHDVLSKIERSYIRVSDRRR